MKSSIGMQLTVVIIGLLTVTVLAFYLINSVFLKKYYKSEAEKSVNQAFFLMNEAGNNDILTDDSTLEELKQFAEKHNLNIFIMNSNSEAVLIAAFNNGEELSRKLMAFILGISVKTIDGKQIVDLEPTPNEVFSYLSLERSTEYLEMFGQLDNGDWYIISYKMENMRTFVTLTSRFIGYVGVLSVIVGAFISWLVAKRFTRPIMEIADLSEKISKLDFDAKYTGHNKNEIGHLGRNINMLSESLQETISELKTVNNELREDLERKEKMEEMRSEFIANVSHELKTPIALIQGYAEGLTECINDDPEEQQFYIDVISDEAAKMNKMVKSLLSLNQLEFGDNVINFERFDVLALIKNYVQSSEILYKAKNINVKLPDMEKCYIWGDPEKTEEVIMNYFTNAVDFCEGEMIIHFNLEIEDKKVKISVFNSGQPIPEESIPHLWEKFYKVDKARTREYGGNGIGLSIVKVILNRMNQEYGVSNYENGVEFWFTMDYAGSEEAAE